jgi:hypothetical protein
VEICSLEAAMRQGEVVPNIILSLLFLILIVLGVMAGALVATKLTSKRGSSGKVALAILAGAFTGGILILFLGCSLYEFPPDTFSSWSEGDVIVFKGGNLIQKDWGAWTLPWSKRSWTHYRQCRPVGDLDRSSRFFYSPQEDTTLRVSSKGDRVYRLTQVNLCVISPQAFFRDERRRHYGSPEAAQAWAEVNELATKALLTGEVGLRTRYQQVEPALREPLQKLGFWLSLGESKNGAR